jgi:hypothetical protein
MKETSLRGGSGREGRAGAAACAFTRSERVLRFSCTCQAAKQQERSPERAIAASPGSKARSSRPKQHCTLTQARAYLQAAERQVRHKAKSSKLRDAWRSLM